MKSHHHTVGLLLLLVCREREKQATAQTSSRRTLTPALPASTP